MSLNCCRSGCVPKTSTCKTCQPQGGFSAQWKLTQITNVLLLNAQRPVPANGSRYSRQETASPTAHRSGSSAILCPFLSTCTPTGTDSGRLRQSNANALPSLPRRNTSEWHPFLNAQRTTCLRRCTAKFGRRSLTRTRQANLLSQYSTDGPRFWPHSPQPEWPPSR